MKLFSKYIIRQKGFSLLEMIVYLAILSFLMSIIILLLSGILNSEKRLVSSKNIQTSSITALDRITREIRQAESVDLTGSTLGTSPGVLELNTIDEGGNAKTVRFSLTGTVMHMFENDIDQGPVTLKGVQVTNLIFDQMTTTNSEAVRVRMTLESGSGTAYKSETFYSTIILRGSY